MSAALRHAAEDTPLSAVEAGSLFAGLAGEARLLAAVSGGPDSVALLALLRDWSRGRGKPELFAATIDHGLRPEAAAEAGMVAELCGKLGVPHVILRWNVEALSSGVQEKARAARYRLLCAQARTLGGAVLVSGHTLDDQAETLLMRLAHGSGPAGLSGMRSRTRKDDVALARPLLGVAKARLVATCRARGLAFVSDPANADPRFERARWRSLAPVLAEIGLGAQRLGPLAARMARLDDAIEAVAACRLAEIALPDGEGGARRLALGALREEPEEIVLRVLARALTDAGGRGDAPPRLERLEACASGLREALAGRARLRRTLSGCVLALDRQGVLTLSPEGPRRRGVHPAPS